MCGSRPSTDLNTALKAIDRQNKHTNYISGPWFDMYLKDRQSVVLNYNPFITYNSDPRPENMDQVGTAARLGMPEGGGCTCRPSGSAAAAPWANHPLRGGAWPWKKKELASRPWAPLPGDCMTRWSLHNLQLCTAVTQSLPILSVQVQVHG